MSSSVESFPCDRGPSSIPLEGACTEEPRPRLLRGLASRLIDITHSCFERATRLPFPFGVIIKRVEDVVDPWMHPLIEALEGKSLGILAAVDGQICAVGSSVEGCRLSTSAAVSKMEQSFRFIPTALYRRGLIGLSADLWVRYEAAVKENALKAVNVANKIPVLNLITPVFCTISAPLASTVSDWLVKHSEVEEKGIQLPYKDSLAHGGAHEAEVQGSDIQPPSITNVKEQACKDRTANPVEAIEEVKEVEEADEPFNSDQEKETIPDVFEMIDSGWLLGSAALSPKKTRAFSRSRSAN